MNEVGGFYIDLLFNSVAGIAAEGLQVLSSGTVARGTSGSSDSTSFIRLIDYGWGGLLHGSNCGWAC